MHSQQTQEKLPARLFAGLQASMIDTHRDHGCFVSMCKAHEVEDVVLGLLTGLCLARLVELRPAKNIQQVV